MINKNYNLVLAIAVVLLAYCILMMSGCGAVKGAGKDIAWIGNGIATLTTPVVDAEDRMTDKMVAKQKHHDLDKATAIVLKNHEKTATDSNQ